MVLLVLTILLYFLTKKATAQALSAFGSARFQGKGVDWQLLISVTTAAPRLLVTSPLVTSVSTSNPTTTLTTPSHTTTETYEEQEELTPYVPAVEAVYGEPPLITPAVEPVVGPLGNVLVEGTEAVYGEAPLISEAVPAVEATYHTVTKTREVKYLHRPDAGR